MPERCPHCGVELPGDVGPFCPECRGDLSERPPAVSGPTAGQWAASYPPTVAAPRERERERPVGITILAVLHLIGGVVLVVAQVALFARLDEVSGAMREIGISRVLLVVGLVFLALLAAASGVGMWLGTRWGWWLAGFYYVYGVARNASALVMFAGLTAEDMAGSTRGPGYYVFKHAVRILVHLWILAYLFRSHVLTFFGMREVSKAKVLAVLGAACAAVFAAAWVAQRLAP